MLCLNEKLLSSRGIIKLYCSNNWEKDDTNLIVNCILEKIREILLNSEKEIIMFCDCTKGEFPPLTIAFNIVSTMVNMKEVLENKLKYTLIYCDSESQKNWLNSILKIYTPVKPVYIVSTEEEIKTYL
jgi:hypothetical protein